MKPSTRVIWLIVRLIMLVAEVGLVVWGFYLIGSTYDWWIMWTAIIVLVINMMLAYVQDDMQDKGDL